MNGYHWRKSDFPLFIATLIGPGVVGVITTAESSKGRRPCHAWKIPPRQRSAHKGVPWWKFRDTGLQTSRGETRGSCEWFCVSAMTFGTVTCDMITKWTTICIFSHTQWDFNLWPSMKLINGLRNRHWRSVLMGGDLDDIASRVE